MFGNMTYDEAFEILVKDGTIHVPAKDAIQFCKFRPVKQTIYRKLQG